MQKSDLWRRWKAGQSLHEIGRAFGKSHSSIRCVVSLHGGFVPAVRRRSLLALTLPEREDISRGIASGSSIRKIAQLLDRAVSTVSREVRRHGGRPEYRASEADQQAWKSALRPKPRLLALHEKLQEIVAIKRMLDWSPEQISGWLKTQYPQDESMRVSHETIYRSLFIQARGSVEKRAGWTSAVPAPHPPLAARWCQRTGTRSNRGCHLYQRKTGGNRGPRCPRSLGGRLTEWLREHSHRDFSGTSFAFYDAPQGAQQRHGGGGRGTDQVRS
jgi:hypothetical protein